MKYVLLISLVIQLGHIEALCSQVKLQNTDTIALINGDPLCYQEYKYFLNRNRAGVIGHYRKVFGLRYAKDFWTDESNQVTPANELKNRALEDAVKVKIQQQLAREYGLIDDIGYANFLTLWQNENQRRKKALVNRQVIYGPEQYTEAGYYDYLLSNLIIGLKRMLTDSVFMITENALAHQYELHKDRLYQRGYAIKANVISQKIKSLNPGDEAQFQMFRQQLLDGRSVAELINDKPQLKCQLVDLNDSLPGREEEEFVATLVRKVSNDLRGIGVSDVVVHNDEMYIVKIHAWQWLGYRRIEECHDQLKDMYVDTLYEMYIQRNIEEVALKIDRNNFNRCHIF